MTVHCNRTENNTYIDCLLKKDNKNLYMKYINKNVDTNEFDKIFNNYISSHNKEFDFYYINCESEIVTNNYSTNIENTFHHDTDYINIQSYLFFYTESKGIKFFYISHMNLITISCLCEMSYKYYINHPMSMLERRINMIIAKNPQLINSLDRNKIHHLIRKYSHIPFQ